MNDTEVVTQEATVDQDYTDFLNRFTLDTHEQDMQRAIQKSARLNVLLFIVLFFVVYANVYQLRQTKLVPFISEIDAHGQTVVRKLVLAKDLPEENPRRIAWISNYIKEWVIDGRFRSADKDVTAGGIRAALQGAAGPARTNLLMEIKTEDVWKRIGEKREKVQVNMPKWPGAFPGGRTWQAEWEEITSGPGYLQPKRQMYSGEFEIAQQDDWITMDNPWGIRIVSATRNPFKE